MKSIFIKSFSLIIFLFSVLNANSQNADSTNFHNPNEDGECSIYGEVVDATGLDGCGMIIKLEDGNVIEPLEIVPNFVLVNGQKILLSYTELHNVGSICMVGQPARIDCITLLNVDSTDNCNVNFEYRPLLSDNQTPNINEDSIPYEVYNSLEFINKSEGFAAELKWDFGDGTYGYDEYVVHTYEKSGEYTVCLTIFTVNGCESSTCMNVTVGEPNPNECQTSFKWYIDSILSDSLIVVFDGIDHSNIVEWNWDFGNGQTSNEQYVTKLSNKKHEYNVCLTTTNKNGCTSSYCEIIYMENQTDCQANFFYEMLDVTIFPTDSLLNSNGFVNYEDTMWMDSIYNDLIQRTEYYTTNPVDPNNPTMTDPFVPCTYPTPYPMAMTYKFNDISEGNAVEWYWEFGDGTTSEEQNPIHYFEMPMNYDFTTDNTYMSEYFVCLTIKTKNGCESYYCEVINIVPEINCETYFYSYNYNNDPKTFAFETEISNSDTSWFWDFNDGTYSYEPNPIHSFRHAGEYQVCLTKESMNGCVSSYCNYVFVEESGNNDCNNSINFAIINSAGANSCDGTVLASVMDDYGNTVETSYYMWSTGEINQSISGLCANVLYSVKATDYNGCETKGSFVLYQYTQPNGENEWEWFYENQDDMYYFDLPTERDDIICTWEFGDGNLVQGQKVAHKFGETGSHNINLVVSDNEGNVLYSKEFMIEDTKTAITEPIANNGFKVYPNPAIDNLIVEYNVGQNSNVTISVINSTGQTMINNIYRKDTGTHNTSLDVSELPSGMYFTRIKLNEQQPVNIRFVK